MLPGEDRRGAERAASAGAADTEGAAHRGDPRHPDPGKDFPLHPSDEITDSGKLVFLKVYKCKCACLKLFLGYP